MFTIKWIIRHNDHQPIHVEESALTDLDRIVEAAQRQVYGMRMKHSASPPDGFVVLDQDGREIRRWLDPLSPSPKPPGASKQDEAS